LLKDAKPEKRAIGKKSWFWKLKPIARANEVNEIDEGSFDTTEFSLIRAWLNELLIDLPENR
jgi:hypothetical protein